MSKLVEELKKQHVAILQIFGEIQSLGIESKEGQAKMQAAKTGLLAHLGKEDKEFYPVMRKAAETDNRLRMLLRDFAQDMEKISGFALKFFDKYAGGGSGIEFAKDFATLASTLKSRISREETILYKEYDEIHPE
jgi:hypothetical protein